MEELEIQKEEWEEEGGKLKVTEKAMRRIQELESEERKVKIENSNYCKTYKEIIEQDTPEYLKRRMNIKDRRMLARYRCGNESKAKDYWKEEKNLVCRVCKEKIETIEHVFRECAATKSGEDINVILSAKALGIETIRRIEKIREKLKDV